MAVETGRPLRSPFCQHAQHERCTSEGCDCGCHHPEVNTRSAAAHRAWQTKRRQRQEQQHASAAETAPKRPEIKPATKAAIPVAAARQIKSEFSLLLWLADNAAAKGVPKYWTTPEDRLTDDERTSLVHATYNEIEARFPKVLKYLAKAQESATEAVLLYTIAMIAAPRLARHGVIPPELASAIVFAPIVIAQVQQSAAAEPGAAGVGAEPASVDHRPNRNGQIDVGEPPFAGSPIQVSPPFEAGHDPLRHGPGDSPGEVNGRYPL